jgi:hypothetical protein
MRHKDNTDNNPDPLAAQLGALQTMGLRMLIVFINMEYLQCMEGKNKKIIKSPVR